MIICLNNRLIFFKWFVTILCAKFVKNLYCLNMYTFFISNFCLNNLVVTSITDVHCTFDPAETLTLGMCTCLYSCLYSCVVMGHLSGLNTHLHWKPALPVMICVSSCVWLDPANRPVFLICCPQRWAATMMFCLHLNAPSTPSRLLLSLPMDPSLSLMILNL